VDTRSTRRAIPSRDRRTGRVVPPREEQRSVEKANNEQATRYRAGWAEQAPAETGWTTFESR
jgi:hypothetical protein